MFLKTYAFFNNFIFPVKLQQMVIFSYESRLSLDLAKCFNVIVIHKHL